MLREQADPERAVSLATPSAVRCAACATLLTSATEALARGGAVDHVFTNPLGVTFAIRCFQRVEHLQLVGVPTVEATWFSGYAWQIALCDSCRVHLGWAFFGDEPFFALIRDRISEG